jgi:hypothetical protein
MDQPAPITLEGLDTTLNALRSCLISAILEGRDPQVKWTQGIAEHVTPAAVRRWPDGSMEFTVVLPAGGKEAASSLALAERLSRHESSLNSLRGQP